MLYHGRQRNVDMHALDERGTIVERSHVPPRHDADLSLRTATPAAKSTQHHSTAARSEWASRPLCVPELFMMQSAPTPGATALHAGERALSYHDLDIWTSQVACHLRALGVGDDERDIRTRVVPLQTGGSRRPFFFLHGHYLGTAYYCFRLARDLGPDQPFYALDPYKLDDLSVPPSWAPS
jgi:hypothetical protein